MNDKQKLIELGQKVLILEKLVKIMVGSLPNEVSEEKCGCGKHLVSIGNMDLMHEVLVCVNQNCEFKGF